MEATYLRVKNRDRFQHYKDRCPPWIKLHRTLITGEDKQLDDFLMLEEWEQWQLVRVWLLSSQCDSFLMAFDERWVRRAIRSTRKVALDKFVRMGFLEVLSEKEAAADRSADKQDASDGPLASTELASEGESASALANARARRAGTENSEHSELALNPGRQSEANYLPINIENELLLARLLQRIGNHADKGTPTVLRAYAAKLPPASLAKVCESLELNQPTDRSAYAVAALRSELEERAA